MSQPDSYPRRHADFTGKLLDMLRHLRNDSLDFPWRNRARISKTQLCKDLIARHFEGRNPGMTQTNAAFLGCDLTREQLEQACLQALTTPHGFSAGHSWADWRGWHRGTWYGAGQGERFNDEAAWDPPRKETTKVAGDNDSTGKPRTYDHQRVHWPGRTQGRWGWNQSHPDVPYIWGWDPKENGDEQGDIGAHVGIPFQIGACRFIIWITPKTAFLEGINTGKRVTQTVNGRRVTGHPKASVEVPDAQGRGGAGQWVVSR